MQAKVYCFLLKQCLNQSSRSEEFKENKQIIIKYFFISLWSKNKSSVKIIKLQITMHGQRKVNIDCPRSSSKDIWCSFLSPNTQMKMITRLNWQQLNKTQLAARKYALNFSNLNKNVFNLWSPNDLNRPRMGNVRIRQI